MNLVGELKRSGRDALVLLIFGAALSAGASWILGLSVASAGVVVFPVLGAIVLVHAPEDVPGAVDNPDGQLSHPIALAAAALVAALAVLASAMLFPSFSSLSLGAK